MPLVYEKFITRKMLRENPDTLFVFGDNIERVGMGGQARECRGEPNAVGIPTKKSPSMDADAFFTDDDLYLFRKHAGDDIERLVNWVFYKKVVVWPEDGIGTGLAQLPQRAPKVWSYIESLKRTLEKIGK